MGRAWVFGDNVNTDIITPGRYNLTTDPKEMAKYCFCEVRPDFPEQVKEGDFVVAGEHFGSGSSRESAALAIHASGIKAVIAPSFARIFYRNAINVGLLPIMAPTGSIKDGDEFSLDLENSLLHNKTQATEIVTQPLPAFMLNIQKAGGIVAYLNANGGRLPEMG